MEFNEDAIEGDYLHLWERRARGGRESVILFARRVDDSVMRLIAAVSADPAETVIVTSLSPLPKQGGYGAHLRRLALLAEQGYAIRESEGLLDGVALICDGTEVTVGLRYKAPEILTPTFLFGPPVDVSDTGFAQMLQDWHSESLPVDSTMMQSLIEELEWELAEADAAHDLLAEAFDTARRGAPDDERTFDVFLPKLSDALQEVLNERRRLSEQRVLARLHQVGWGSDSYLSLLPEGTVDMTEWDLPDGKVHLTRIQMYPVILNPSGRMGFARVAKTRISYVRPRVNWTSSYLVGDMRCSLAVSFPQEGTDTVNMVLKLRPVSHQTTGVEAHVRFDGIQAALVKTISLQDGNPDGLGESLSQSIVSSLQDPLVLGRLISKALRPFKFKELLRHKRDAGDFFPHNAWLHLQVFDFQGSAVLVASTL